MPENGDQAVAVEVKTKPTQTKYAVRPIPRADGSLPRMVSGPDNAAASGLPPVQARTFTRLY